MATNKNETKSVSIPRLTADGTCPRGHSVAPGADCSTCTAQTAPQDRWGDVIGR